MRRKLLGVVAASVLGSGLGLGLTAAPASAAARVPMADCVAYTVQLPGLTPPAYPIKLGFYFSWYAQLPHDAC